jgi:predicted MPP superfamily phosphohydrolase
MAGYLFLRIRRTAQPQGQYQGGEGGDIVMAHNGLLEKAVRMLEKEPRLIELPAQGKIVFVGDTHGDLDASQEVVDQYLKKPYRIVFLGDYIDRGQDSEKNIKYLLETKLKHPDQIFLLAGNHEGYQMREFYPADFWNSLSTQKKEEYGLLFSKLPLAAFSQNGILALHGALPDMASLAGFNQITWGDDNWLRTTWGDFAEGDVEEMGEFGGRPQFGRPYFEKIMDRFQKKVLVRSHQPHAPLFMFEKRCLTIFTSDYYTMNRTIAIADLEKEIKSAEDLAIERI